MRPLACLGLACVAALLWAAGCSPPWLSGPSEIEGCGCIDLWEVCADKGGCRVEEAQRSACQDGPCLDGRLALDAGDAVVRIPVDILAEDLEQFPTLRAEISTAALPDAPDESVLLSVSFDEGATACAGRTAVDCDVPPEARVVLVRVHEPAQLPSADLLLHLKEATCGEDEHFC